MSTSTPPPFTKIPHVDELVGAAFLGVVAASILYGVTALQTYTYFHKFQRDPPLQKIAVILLWALDTAHMWTCIQGVYMYIVTGFGNIFGMDVVNWPLKLGASVQVVLIVLVQVLYSQRIWKLSGMHGGILKYFIVIVVAAGAGLGVVLGIVTWQKNTFTDLESDTWIIYSAFGAATAIDLGISVSLVWYLGSSVAPSSALNSVISRAMQYSLGSGAVTSTCSLACVLAFLLKPKTFIFVGLQLLLTKLYTTSYMAMLNARPSHRAQEEITGDTKVDSYNLTTLPKLYRDQSPYDQRMSSIPDYSSARDTLDMSNPRPSPTPPSSRLSMVNRNQPSFNNNWQTSQGSMYSQNHPQSYASVESGLTHVPENEEYYQYPERL